MENELTAPATPTESGKQIIPGVTPAEFQPRFERGDEPKTFIDESELLRRLPISRRTSFNWIQSGKLPCVKIGRRKLFHWPSVEAALLRQQRGAN